MKKFKSLFAVLAFGGLILSGCFGKTDNKEPEQQQEGGGGSGGSGSGADTVLVDDRCEKWVVVGQNKLIVGEEEVNNEWNATEHNAMTAISLNQAKAIDATLGTTLQSKELKGLYKYEGVVLGTRDDVTWPVDLMRDGVKETSTGSYSVKALGVDKNEDDEWVNSMWCPSAEVHGESLTPTTLFITENMAEEAVDGFDHNSNPVALEAGVYTLVLATYKQGVGAFGIMCGLGLIKTADREGFVPPEVSPVTSVDVAGTFNSWGGTPCVLTKDGNVFEGVVALAANDEFKVRINNDWPVSFGKETLETGVYNPKDGGDDNIKVTVAGNYKIHLELSAEAMADINSNKTIISFTVSAVA